MIKIETTQELDEAGELEQLTFDLFPIVDSGNTLHLDENGLPKIGTFIKPGTIIIGKLVRLRNLIQIFSRML